MTYDELKTAFLQFAHRSDVEEVFDTLLRLAENRINERCNFYIEKKYTFDAGLVDFIVIDREIIRVRYVFYEGKPLIERDFLEHTKASSTPKYWYRTDQLLWVDSFDVLPAEVTVRATTELVPITSLVQSNPIVDKSPTLYLYALLRELAVYLDNDQDLVKYERLFETEVAARNDRKSEACFENLTKTGGYGAASDFFSE